MYIFPTRLPPNSDIRLSLEALAKEQGWSAAFIISVVGSLKVARLRMAGASEVLIKQGPFEIFALTGTLAPSGAHLHIGLSDAEGSCIGGHLCHGSLIYTTAEVIIGFSEEHTFERVLDPQTGYPELTITPR
jgi:uncharacterized protein